MPEDLRQIQWREYGETVLHPLSVVLLLVMVAWILLRNDRYILIPLLLVGAFVTSVQRLVIASFDFTILRLLLLAFLARAVLRNDTEKIEWSPMDTLFVSYVIIASAAYIALRGTSGAVTNRLGFAFDAFLTFFVVRVYLTGEEQLRVLMRAFCVVLALVAFTMTIEQLTQYNVFSVFGDVSPITGMREGNIRARGAFSHAILAGTFGAVFVPVAWGLRGTGRSGDRQLSNIGMAGGVVMTLASASSGPIISLLAALFGIAMWKYRQYVRQLVRWSVLGLVALHFYMQAPVWHLISRVDLVGGSTGWHRYALIDRAISNFGEWALFGVHSTGHWGWGLNDVTNMFVLQGVRGGFLTLLLFVLVIRKGFHSVGKSVNQSTSAMEGKLSWCWGAVLFAHCVTFFGVSYFGQMDFFWYLSLAVVCSLPRLFARRRDAAPVQ